MTQPEKLFTAGQVAAELVKIGETLNTSVGVLSNTLRIALIEKVPEGQVARTLRYKLKTANKELGRAGARIYELRAQLAEIRGLISPNNRTSHRTLAQKNRELNETINLLRKQLDDAAINWVPREPYVEAGRTSGGLTF